MMDINQMGNEVRICAPAKINLFLEVVRKREDGYHDLETVMQEIDLVDNLTFKETEEGVSLDCDDKSIPCGEENLVCKAANLIIQECGIKKGVNISLKKNIPVGAGLGGGSSDAAATLKALNMLWRVGLTDEELMAFAAKLGSDVAFFIKGKTSLCKGRGEIIYPIEVKNKLNYLLIFPHIRIDTITIYKNLKIGLTKNRKDVSFFLDIIERGNAESVGKLLFNRLEEPVFSLYPNLLQLKSFLKQFDFCGLLVSGSGSSIVGLCSSREQAVLNRDKIASIGKGEVFVVTNAVLP
ncbi:MAG: 4-(cytidine 5'-diphospho)-2-C-methyl-D-erythritol kinase [Planctomycetes bacterium]|nr:4-(cytidine 5'-diphospho)-2-C-methyl-D-erythritol kinase [Planctomycetota bacterium]